MKCHEGGIKQMKNVQKLTMVFVIFILIFASNTVLIKADETDDASNKNLFLLKFNLNCEHDSCSLGGIKVDIYSSKRIGNKTTNAEYTMSEFQNSYAFSVYTNVDGAVTFEKPSSEFLIMIDVPSLPAGTGVEIQTKFYRGEETEDTIEITEIGQIEVKQSKADDDAVTVEVYNKMGKRISAFYTISKDESDDLHNSIVDRSKSIKGKVTAGDKVVPYEFTVAYSKEQRITRISEALSKKQITKYDAVKAYYDIYREYGISTQLCGYVIKLKKDAAFYCSLDEDAQQWIDEMLAFPSYNRTYSSERFEIHYSSSSSTTPTFITSLMSELQAADTSLCSGLSFSQPRSNSSGTAKYEVYVTSATSGDAVASTYPDVDSGVRISHIVFWDVSNLYTNLTPFQKATVAHEYMHAIVHTYRDMTTLPFWFNEAWAEWAVVHVKGLSDTYLNVSDVNGYLNNSYKSLIGDDDVYGKLLFPLYIKQTQGGDTAVANAVKYLASNPNVYTTIGSVIYGSENFYSTFPNYMRFVYKPKALFYPYLNGWNNTAYISANYGLSNYPNNVSGGPLNPLAANYWEFDVPSAPYHLDITVNLSSNYTTFAGKLLMSNSTGGITNLNFTPVGLLVTYSIDINVPYVKGCVMFASKNPYSTTNYSFTIARS